jgi:hypothetical protein
MKYKKTLLIAAILTITVGTVSGIYYSSTNLKSTLTERQVANIQALSDDEEHYPCDNYNGYRRIQEGNERIYDCCYKEQVGKGKDDCKKW